MRWAWVAAITVFGAFSPRTAAVSEAKSAQAPLPPEGIPDGGAPSPGGCAPGHVEFTSDEGRAVIAVAPLATAALYGPAPGLELVLANGTRVTLEDAAFLHFSHD